MDPLEFEASTGPETFSIVMPPKLVWILAAPRTPRALAAPLPLVMSTPPALQSRSIQTNFVL